MRQMKWRPASEIELDEPETVMVSVKVGDRGSFVDLAWCDLETFTPTDGDTWPDDAEVTHWMPLPEPPEKGVETDWEYFRYHTLAARATLYPGKSFDEVDKIVDDMIKKSEDSTDVN